MTNIAEDFADVMRDQQVATVCGMSVTRGQLDEYFKRVQNKEHWKNPIDATVRCANGFDLAMYTEAVIFFTGSVPTFSLLGRSYLRKGARFYRVRAAGYFATIGV